MPILRKKTTMVANRVSAVLASLCLLFSTQAFAQQAKDTAKSAKDTAKSAKDTAKSAKDTAKTTATTVTDAKAPAPTATTPAPPATTPDPTAGSSAFNPQMVKHRAMLVSTEEKVNSLKEKIFRSKAQLMLLQEKLLHGVISTAKLKLSHDNRMGNSFFLMSAAYSLDGRPIFSRSDKEGSLNDKKKFILFQESISPGAHRVTVDLRLRGNGFGIFSYLRGYKFRIQSSYPFTAQEGKIIEIKVVPFQKGWTVPLDKRAALKYEVKVRKLFASKAKVNKVLKQDK